MTKQKTIAEILQDPGWDLKEFGVTGPRLWALRTILDEGQF
ncbi:MAG TPA: hypothetical protein VFH55_04435 [Nitrospiria bacterium]|nr:hypothetical protein [Nitrospiria bacterium]